MARFGNIVIKRKIKDYKKFFESSNIFSYEYREDGQSYYYVAYYKFDIEKATGYLILSSDGDVVPFGIAKSVLRQFQKYNACITSASKQLAKYKEYTVKMFEELLHHLALLEKIDSINKTDVKTVSELSQTYIEQKKRLNELYEELIDIDMVVQQKRGYLTPTEVEHVYELLGEFNRLLYNSARKSRETLPSFKSLHQFCLNHKREISEQDPLAFRRLNHVLESFNLESSIKTLQETLRDFERDENGNQVTFSSGEKGLWEYDKMNSRIGEYEFNQKIVPLIRNP